MRYILYSSILILAVVVLPVKAGHIKVDFDTRSDATATGFQSWLAAEGTSKTIDDLVVSFQFLDKPDHTDWKISWYNKNGLNNYELAMDSLYSNYNDDVTEHPSVTNETLELTLTGLAEGDHTFISYHNAIWPYEKYNRYTCSCSVYVDGEFVTSVTPSQYATDDNDVASTFFHFEAIEGQPVVITFVPEGDPASEICTVVLNAFEIDNLASEDSYASTPFPADGDKHVDVGLDTPTAGAEGTGSIDVTWQVSSYASYQDVYFGTDYDAVAAADRSDTTGVFRDRVNADLANYNFYNLNTKDIYYWRVDTVLPDNEIVKGYIWSFKGRHQAFTTAEGYGRFANGGRYGRVIAVTTLEDYDPDTESVIEGTLRWALEEESGPRIVVFNVGGSIDLKQRISIRPGHDDVYVAGQTAPGQGICITRYGFGCLSAEDVIIRHVRNRVGDYCQKAMDGIGLADSNHCIVDHCSISWTIDEAHSSRSAKNITFQWNLISEALNESYHYDDSDPDHQGTQPHAFAASISGNKGSYHHNLLAHCTQRNWSLAGGLEQDGLHYAGYVDIRNNVVYNWQSSTTAGGCKNVNFVNNYYKPGPAMTADYLMRPGGDELNLGDMQMFYIVGNRMVGKISPASDNWDYVEPEFATEAEMRSDEPLFDSDVVTETADESYDSVLNGAGALCPGRDDIDLRIVSEVQQGDVSYYGSIGGLPGIIDSQDDVGGYPVYQNGPVPVDTDKDGLPDWVEVLFNTNINSAQDDFSDTFSDPDGDGYTYMDQYLEYLAKGNPPFRTFSCPGWYSR